MSAGAFVEREGRRSRIGDLNLVQGGIAARTKVRAAFRLRARLLLEFQEGIARLGARLLHERLQLTGIEPQSVAALADIDFDILEMQDEEREVAFWADAYHDKSSSAE